MKVRFRKTVGFFLFFCVNLKLHTRTNFSFFVDQNTLRSLASLARARRFSLCERVSCCRRSGPKAAINAS